MSRPRVTSTSTRDAVAPPARKNRVRSEPVTSTTSPRDQPPTDRCEPARPHRAVQRVHALTRLAPCPRGRPVDHDRNVHTDVAARAARAAPGRPRSRPTSRTSLTGLRAVVDHVRVFVLCADMHITSADHATRRRGQRPRARRAACGERARDAARHLWTAHGREGREMATRATLEEVALVGKNVRRRPTLPQPPGCSTIGAERLNFRVRDGTGYFPLAMAAVTLAGSSRGVITAGGRSFRSIQLSGLDSLWTRARCVCRLLSWLSVCETSPRPISTGRLGIAAVHLRPINPVFCWGPYPLDVVGNLILKRASRLDAFSGYHFRT